MTFPEALEEVRKKSRVSIEQFMAEMGLSRDAYHKWMRGGSLPGMSTLALFRKRYGVDFLIDRDTGETEIKELFDPEVMELQSVAEVVDTEPARHNRVIKAPSSAREVYEEMEFYGGKPDWMELPDTERLWYEAMYSIMEIEIDSANDERDLRVSNAIANFRRAARQRMLEQE